ncbi:hypothetical protein B7486_64465, partial [cyanobacterium TDX16]
MGEEPDRLVPVEDPTRHEGDADEGGEGHEGGPPPAAAPWRLHRGVRSGRRRTDRPLDHTDHGSSSSAPPPPIVRLRRRSEKGRWSPSHPEPAPARGPAGTVAPTSSPGGHHVAEQPFSTDYLVMGAGAVAMAFTDALLEASEDATVVLVDRRDRPGGHWNDAYPFVRLHQPSSFYGVSSV